MVTVLAGFAAAYLDTLAVWAYAMGRSTMHGMGRVAVEHRPRVSTPQNAVDDAGRPSIIVNDEAVGLFLPLGALEAIVGTERSAHHRPGFCWLVEGQVPETPHLQQKNSPVSRVLGEEHDLPLQV